MLFRPATMSDLGQVNMLREDVSDLHRKARPDIFHPGEEANRKEIIEVTSVEMLNDENKDILVCVDGDTVAAFACVDYVVKEATKWTPLQRYCYLKEFGVAQAYRRKGLGKALMGFLQEEAAKRRIHRIELDVWAFNTGAIQLYEGLGFRTRYKYMELDF